MAMLSSTPKQLRWLLLLYALCCMQEHSASNYVRYCCDASCQRHGCTISASQASSISTYSAQRYGDLFTNAMYMCRSAEEDLRATLFAFDQPSEGRHDRGRGFRRGGRGRGRRY